MSASVHYVGFDIHKKMLAYVMPQLEAAEVRIS